MENSYVKTSRKRWKNQKMKKKLYLTIIMAILTILSFAGCGKEETPYLGFNAQITEIDSEKQILYIEDSEEEDIFGDNCAIDCSKAIEKNQILYCDYKNGTIKNISFEDLQAGDEVILNFYESELEKIKSGTAKTEQVQLGTQRLND